MDQKAIATAIGKAKPLPLGDKIYVVEPLDFNDLADIELRFDTIENLKVETVEEMRFFMWLLLRKADPSLSAEDKDLCNYTLTELQAGKMLTFELIRDGSVKTFILEALKLSGFVGGEEKRPIKKRPARGGAITESSPSSSSDAASPDVK